MNAETWIARIENLIELDDGVGQVTEWKKERPSRSPCTRFVVRYGPEEFVTIKVYHDG